MKRVAFRDPAQPQPDASPGAVRFDGLHHVFRAGGLKAAGRWQQRRNPSLIDTQAAENKCPDHFAAAGFADLQRSITFMKARSRSANGASMDARRGLMTTSQPAAISGR